MPEIVDFLTAALNDTLRFNDQAFANSYEYFNAYLNYLYVPTHNVDDFLIENSDTLVFDLSLLSDNGGYLIQKDTLRNFINTLNSSLTNLAQTLDFPSNENLDFISIDFQYLGEISNNSIGVKLIIFWGEANQFTGCSFTSDFASKDITRQPNSNDGDCYNQNGQHYADKQLRSALNDPNCNDKLGCIDYLDLTPQTGNYTNGPYTVGYTKIANSFYDIAPTNDWTLWYSLSPNPVYQCITSNRIQDYFEYCVGVSVLNRPTYNIIGSTKTVKKAIDYYVYDTWIQDSYDPYIPINSYYHFCGIRYNVCVKFPIYPLALKNHDDWRGSL